MEAIEAFRRSSNYDPRDCNHPVPMDVSVVNSDNDYCYMFSGLEQEPSAAKGRSYQFSRSQLHVDLGSDIGNEVQAMIMEAPALPINGAVPPSSIVKGHNTDTS
ncbi:hypothetical protein CU097_004408 [Rhizopus azygosporus]|uniref:Uncharacterized protein n=1 Tax=Rhizopus azygosporus TaxID=86630 RepID=A0A367IZE9_RHIAZ|nr:hypothetical protein CU097_004408 [Rhizopus azygosporus]